MHLDEALQQQQDRVEVLIRRNREILNKERKMQQRLQRALRECDGGRMSRRRNVAKMLQDCYDPADPHQVGLIPDWRVLEELERKADAILRPKLEEALRACKLRQEGLRRLGKSLSIWRSACANGSISEIPTAARRAIEQAAPLRAEAIAVQEAWNFDGQAYLEGNIWIEDLRRALEKHGIRTFPEGDYLVAPPLVIRPIPEKLALQMDKKLWRKLRPSYVANEIARIRKNGGVRGSKELLEHIFRSAKKMAGRGAKEHTYVRLRELYDRWCEAPEWKKENPDTVFGQAILALETSGLRTTRDGTHFTIDGPSGSQDSTREKNVLTAYTPEGSLKRYYAINFFR
ncbi:MAG: hypothetical protein ACP5VE_15185 [Chthonomonadales bacterium]